MPERNPARLAFIRKRQTLPPVECKVTIGYGCNIADTARIGFDGFGYEPDENGQLIFFPHHGHVIIGNRVDIGELTCIDRGTIEDTIIGNGTKIDNLVHIGHNCVIGENVSITPGVVLGGSVRIGNGTFVGMNATIMEHLTVGENCVIGMGAVVVKDVPEGETWAGNPARRIK